MPRLEPRSLGILSATASATLIAATLLVALLQDLVGVPDASSVYLLAVVITSFVGGTVGAMLSAVGSFLLYDFFFIEPTGTLVIHDAGPILDALLLLAVGIVVGELAALQRARAAEARSREREARALFLLSRVLATRESTKAVLREIAAILRTETRAQQVWISLGPDDASERVAADTGGNNAPRPVAFASLRGAINDEAPGR